MSDYKAIHAVGETLRQVLLAEMKNDSSIYGASGIIKSEDQVTLEHPYSLIGDGEAKNSCLSLFLYKVSENSDMKNRAPLLSNGSTYTYPPLALNLHYMLTPLTNSAENNHRLLGKAMQTLYDASIIKGSELQDELQGTAEELRVTLAPISMEDITKLWSAVMRPFQLSAAYDVRVLYIDSYRQSQKQPVYQKKADFVQIP